jgi:hypothetical protein
MIGEEGIAPIGGILPTSGGKLSGRPVRETFGPPGRRDWGTWAQRPGYTGWPWSRRRPGDGSDGGRHGPSGLAAPVRVRPFPRRGYRLDDPGQEAGPALRPDESRPSGWRAQRMSGSFVPGAIARRPRRRDARAPENLRVLDFASPSS